MMDKRDAEDALKDLDGREFGYKRRKLRIEWASQREADRKKDTRPSKTLFVVNFDVRTTTERDIEDHFSPYGRLVRVQIKRNYAFVQYSTLEEATKAFQKCNQTQVRGRTISIEYTQNEDPQAALARQSEGGGRSRSGSPVRRRRSPSPVRRRGSPSPVRRGRDSPSPPRARGSPSPRRGRSPVVATRRDRSRSPSYTRKRSYSR